MITEWRNNLWLIIELVVVFTAIWALGTVLYVKTKGLFTPMGVEPENVYSITSKWISTENPGYSPIDTTVTTAVQAWIDDLKQIVRAIKENPNVESVGVHSRMIPYNYNYYGIAVEELNNKDSIIYQCNRRDGSPDMIKVLGVKSLTGLTDDQLVEKMRKGEILISNNPRYESQGRDPKDFIGKIAILTGDSTKQYRVGDVVQLIRRTEYEEAWDGCVIVPLDEETEFWGDVAVKVKPGRDKQFKVDFKNNPALRKYRNVYLSDMKSLLDIRETCQKGDEVNVRTFLALMVFLLVTVFLGLLGTFWFRMQQRVSEIAIRKVCGATRGDVFRRILSEGMILLVCAAILVSAIIWPFIETFENMIYERWYVFLIVEVITFVFVAVGIVVSLWYPARKAMNIEPAIAIKDL